MARKETLNSDVDFIREFEELKIKQRLLIENLKKKGQINQEKLFLEINSKLDFLVKIFQENNSSTEDGADDESSENTSNPVVDKLDAFEKSFNEKFINLEEKINDALLKLKSESSKVKTESLNMVSGGDLLPPKPDFESKIEDVKDSTEKKKSKWF